MLAWAQAARCHNALGDLTAARAAFDRASAFAARLTGPSMQVQNLLAASDETHLALGEGWEEQLKGLGSVFGQQASEGRWALAVAQAAIARVLAHSGQLEQSLAILAMVIPAIERADFGNAYTRMACDAVATLWTLGRPDHIEAIERNLREKVIAPDWRYPMFDGRLSLARLCAPQGRYDEARDWFGLSRSCKRWALRKSFISRWMLPTDVTSRSESMACGLRWPNR